jgi:FkbM family methyltransferase
MLKTWLSKFQKQQYWVKSFSQEGEDMVLRKEFQDKLNGFYIDIGAYHPKKYSNTYYFYSKGWRGINVDATPGSMDSFKKERPNDINLEVAISNSKSVLTYYTFNEPALNTFSQELAAIRDGVNSFIVTSKTQIQTYSLEEILDKHLPSNIEIDFLDVDVEGFDYQVLSSNNWNKYRPKLILAEQTGTSIEENLSTEIGLLMSHNGYKLYSFIRKVAIYKDSYS